MLIESESHPIQFKNNLLSFFMPRFWKLKVTHLSSARKESFSSQFGDWVKCHIIVKLCWNKTLWLLKPIRMLNSCFTISMLCGNLFTTLAPGPGWQEIFPSISTWARQFDWLVSLLFQELESFTLHFGNKKYFYAVGIRTCGSANESAWGGPFGYAVTNSVFPSRSCEFEKEQSYNWSLLNSFVTWNYRQWPIL